MANTVIQLKHSTLTGNVPSSLANGEISINSRDGKFFYSTPAGVVVTHYPYPGPAGLNQEIQFNDSGVLGTNSGLTFSKTTGVFTAPIVASSNNGQGTNFKVGDDTWLGDINLADTLSIRGQQNVNNAYISFGASNANTLGRAGTGPLTYTGNFVATGELSTLFSSGDEGGQINFGIPQTNTTLSSGVAIDVYQNRLRFWETGGTNRGVYIDLTTAATSVGTNLLSSSTSTDTFARNQANAAFLQANTPSFTANSAASYANSAFLTANTPTHVANSAASYANSAFGRANTAAVAANTPSFTANSAASYANSAFARANNSLDANNGGTVTGTITATSFITTGSFGNILGANTIYANNFVANTGFIQFADGSKQFTANAPSHVSNSAASYANSAFIAANAAFLQANTPDYVANSASSYANAAFLVANTPTHVANSAASYANSGFAVANSGANYANSAYTRANNSVNANTGGVITGDITITGNLIIQGNTFTANAGILTSNDTLFLLGTGNYTADALDVGFAAHYNAGTNAHTGFIRDVGTKEWYIFKNYTPEVGANNNININDASFTIDTLNANLKSTLITLKGIDLLPYVNNAYTAANTADTKAVNSGTYANAAFLVANTPTHVANSAASYANSGFAVANSAASYANAAFVKANTASGASASGYLTNSVIFANSTGVLSNTANLQFFTSNNTLVVANTAVATLGDVLALSIALG